MHRHLRLAALTGVAALAAGVALAQDTPQSIAVEIRHGHMLNYAASLQVLGGMAQGKVPYDAAAAKVAADNLFHLASINEDHYWLEGTAVGQIEDSNAKPEIWQNMDDFHAKQKALLDAATAMQTAAGTDLASLQGAMGAVGGACGACHQAYRQAEQ